MYKLILDKMLSYWMLKEVVPVYIVTAVHLGIKQIP
jgi:hypothetical protein